MKKCISVFAISIATILFISGCRNASRDVICDPSPFTPRAYWDEFGIFEFPNDYFPYWISFETEFETYSSDVRLISSTLTSTRNEPFIHGIHTGHGFGLVKQTNDGWIEISLEGGSLMASVGVSYGFGFTYNLVNGCVNWDEHFKDFSRVYPDLRRYPDGALFTNTHRLAPGIYRKIQHVFTEERYSRWAETVSWSGYIWAEFEVR